jgi:hypothetical protein
MALRKPKMNEDAIYPKYYDWRNSVPNNLNT